MRRLIHTAAEEADRRARVRAAFGTYVAEAVVERILAGDLKPRTERREISVMFVDIRDFTRISEGLEPAVLLQRLNCALEAFSLEVQRRGGVVNKYLGDGLMALFGAPEEQADHARRAVDAAAGVRSEAARLVREGAFPGLKVGVGIHTGEVVIGDVGGMGHREYTAIGDVVNVASRVESANKELGTEVLLTAAVRECLGECLGDGVVALRAHEPIVLRNRTEPVRVYELLDGPEKPPAGPEQPLAGPERPTP